MEVRLCLTVRQSLTSTSLFWFPSSGLGTEKPKLQLRETGSWSFQICIPKPELGNEYGFPKAVVFR